MTSDTRSRKARAKTRASEKIRSRSQAQIPAQTPLVGAGWTSQIRFIVAWSSPKTAVAPMNSVTRPMTVATAPLRARRGENAGDEVAAGRPHQAFELRGELLGHVLPIEHQPDHTNDQQHQGPRDKAVVGQRGGQPQAVGLCRKFSFEVIWGMLSPYNAVWQERERNDGGELQGGPLPTRDHSTVCPLAWPIPSARAMLKNSCSNGVST